MFDFSGAKELISVEVSITEGPHTGFERTLKLQQQQQRSIAKVGRSTGKLFEDYGISLPHDGEVSTTHGKVCPTSIFSFPDLLQGYIAHSGLLCVYHISLKLSKDAYTLKIVGAQMEQ